MLLFCICSSVEAYSRGAPRGACYSLKPGHSGYAQAASSVPTTCALSTYTQNSGGSVNLYLNGGDFKGFLVQALDGNGNVIGTFSPPANGKCLACQTSCDSITHTNSGVKNQVVATWTSPSSYVGKVFFRYTIASNYNTYWVAVNGPALTIT